MKTTIILYLITIVTCCSVTTNSIIQYRRQYTKIANQLIQETNTIKQNNLRVQLETLKTNNLALFQH